jgi:RHS repeat-associated protein
MGSGGSQINTWNVENQLISNGAVDGSGNLLTYTYDPWGKRVLQYSVCARCSQGSGTLYFYSISGQRLGSYQLNDYPPGYGGIIVLTPMYIPQYFGRRMLVAMDRLGSVRNSQNGSMAYYPWGEEELQSNGTTTPDGTDKFGTYFRDSSVAGVGQDYANARYYNNNFGRFWSSDPGGIATADQKNPQSWKRYAYVNDDPVNGYDPTGKDVVLIFDPGSFWSPTPTAMSICMINPGACSPWGTGPEGVSATADGGGGGVSFGAAQAIFQKGAAKIATMNFSSKCSTDLAAVGTTATAVQADATYLANPANSNAIQNGAVSTVLESSLWANTLGYNGAVADFGNMTIGQYMAQNAGTVAEAQLNGNTIYINPSLINSGPSNYYFNTATVLHEVLHNVTGLGDPAVQTDLGLPVSKDTSNITNRLIADCF